MNRLVVLAASLLSAFALDAARIHASTVDPATVCSAAKIKAAGKDVYARSKCEQRALRSDAVVDPTCLAAADRRCSTAFDTAEAAGGCADDGDAATVASLVAACVDGFVADTSGAGRCRGAKVRTTGKRVMDELGCHRRGMLQGLAASPLCLERAATKFALAFAKADSLDSCTGAADELATSAETCVGQVMAPIVTTTTPSTTTTTTLPPAGTCCQLSGSCADFAAATAADDCAALGGMLAPAGLACDGVAGNCAPPPTVACCQQTAQGTLGCMDGTPNQGLFLDCAAANAALVPLGGSATLVLDTSCDGATGACGAGSGVSDCIEGTMAGYPYCVDGPLAAVLHDLTGAALHPGTRCDGDTGSCL
jgi:hypothetical protein